MVVEKKWVKKLPSWQANNFSDLNFFVEFCARNFLLNFQNGENCRSVDWVCGKFSVFIRNNFRGRKNEITCVSIVWELREFWKNYESRDVTNLSVFSIWDALIFWDQEYFLGVRYLAELIVLCKKLSEIQCIQFQICISFKDYHISDLVTLLEVILVTSSEFLSQMNYTQLVCNLLHNSLIRNWDPAHFKPLPLLTCGELT
jgi:hypothetical protein